MNSKLDVKSTVTAALLCSIGIIIPLFSPIKIILEPASFTLASHVAIFIAMFISPSTALFVAFGTTAGFLFGGFPIVVVLRALSHVVFVLIGSLYIKKNKKVTNSIKSSIPFSFGIGIVHAVCEVLIVIPFYFGFSLSEGYYTQGFFTSVLCLVGIGTVIHSIIDFSISVYIWNLLPKAVTKRLETKTIS